MTSVRGDFGCAFRSAEAALAVAERIDHQEWAVAARFMLGRLWLELLDLSRAAAELEPALAAARLCGSRFWISTVAATLASVHLARADPGHAAALLGTAGAPERACASMGQRQCWFAQAELALARGDPARALAIVDQLITAAPDPSPEQCVPQLAKLRGDALARLGRADEAEQVYLAARTSAALFGFRPLLWRIDLARGTLYQAAGQRAAAAAAFHDARAMIAELAATIEDEAVRERFHARASALLPAEETRAPPTAVAARLSPRELEVLRLIVEGQSDREIAEALTISPRTVMRHVTGILTKLNVSSRTAAATLALRQGIV